MQKPKFSAKLMILFNLFLKKLNNITFDGMGRYRIIYKIFIGVVLVGLSGCIQKKEAQKIEQSSVSNGLKYATGFQIRSEGSVTIIEVSSPWPGSETTFSYALVPKEELASISLPADTYDAIIATPVQNMVITSTTHIPSLEALGVLNTVVGFPNTDLISSPTARKKVTQGKIKELGTNENVNTEIVLELNPELVVGFGINDTNKAYETLVQSGIPLVYNGDWTEQSPLGKAEWIKFFAPFFNKNELADSIFKKIEQDYLTAKKLAHKATTQPSVLTGGLYKDVWYVAGGNSWMAQFLDDANANYLWSDSDEKGSIGLSLEAVLEKASRAEYWFNPSLHASYRELLQANSHYEQFRAFGNSKIYSNAIRKGETGGLLFYELAPQRPDLVLKDLISILHPGLLPNYEPHFFRPLE